MAGNPSWTAFRPKWYKTRRESEKQLIPLAFLGQGDAE
jgi:hypothetical protein